MSVSPSLPVRLYRTLGVSSVYEAGRDAWLIIFARSSRMFAYGASSVFIALFFSSLGFSDFRIGLFMTLTLAGDVVLTLFLTAVADGLGRRKILFSGSLLMVCSGLVFVFFENYWLLLLAAVVGVISPSGGDFGPFRAIEESVLSQLTTADDRSNVLSWYVTASSLGSAIGTEVGGRIVQSLARGAEASDDTPNTTGRAYAYHMVYGMYVIFGIVNMACAALLSHRTELENIGDVGDQRGQSEEAEILLERLEDREAEHEVDEVNRSVAQEPAPATADTKQSWISSRLAQMSDSTRSVMFKLWPLLAVDSLADGMVSYSLTAYYIEQKFHVTPSYLGDITSISYFLAALSTIFAGPLANSIGLINTMVFTHVPSSTAVLLFPIPKGLTMTIVLFFIRTLLNNMDQAPRVAFIAQAVPSNERTAVNGITSMLRTLASTAGPTLTGGLADRGQFWIAFVVAGSLRLAYDFGLWALFVNMPIRQQE